MITGPSQKPHKRGPQEGRARPGFLTLPLTSLISPTFSLTTQNIRGSGRPVLSSFSLYSPRLNLSSSRQKESSRVCQLILG